MGSRGGYHGCPMGRIPKPPGPQGTLGPLGPQGLIGPQGLMAPQGTQGSGSMAWIWFFSMVVEGAGRLLGGFKLLRPANNPPSRSQQGGEGEGSPSPWWLLAGGWRHREWLGGTEAQSQSSTRHEARGLGGFSFFGHFLFLGLEKT